MAPFEALYGRKCRSPLCWTELSKRKQIRPEIVDETSEQINLIKKRLLTAQSRHKSYADKRRRPLEFEVGDHVFLKISSVTGVGRAIKRKKLSPRYIGPFEILEKQGPVAYQLAMLPSQKPERIIDYQEKQLRHKSIPSMKVVWRGLSTREATWETVQDMKEKYPEFMSRSMIKGKDEGREENVKDSSPWSKKYQEQCSLRVQAREWVTLTFAYLRKNYTDNFGQLPGSNINPHMSLCCLVCLVFHDFGPVSPEKGHGFVCIPCGLGSEADYCVFPGAVDPGLAIVERSCVCF
ncbi:hypothetical protein K1719_026321 [Acacia pycnantha]|nr:hypothetical protein K1719_026321 [Acacia pycnantha]